MHAVADLDNPRLREALASAQRGWPVFPIYEPLGDHVLCGRWQLAPETLAQEGPSSLHAAEAKAGLAYGVPAKLARKDGKKSPEHMVWRFTAAWCGVDEKTAAKAMQWLLRHHFIEKVGEYGRTAPGKPGRRVRYLRVSPRSIEGLIAYSARREEIRKAKGLDRSEPVGDEWRE